MLIRAVLDTNIIVSALLSKRGPSHDVVGLVLDGRYRAVVSVELQAEYEGTLGSSSLARRLDVAAEEVSAFLGALYRSSDVVPVVEDLPVRIRDIRDNHVLGTALAARADYVVTGDLDLLTLDGDPALAALHIVTPRTFLTVLARNQNGASSR